ncbi:hypothetical protein FOVSG1_003516 [Fusarium oxysporum f. sp. vasinfectum]
MKHLLAMRGPTLEIFASYLLFAALEVEGSKGMQFLRFLLESGVSPDSIDPNNCRCSALHRAVKLDSKVAVELLLTYGADPDAQTKITKEDARLTPLHYALVLYNDGEVAKTLINFGANVNSRSVKPLIQAVKKGNSALIRHMLEAGADPKLLPVGGFSVIYYAIHHHESILVNMLIEAGVNSNLLIEELQDADIEFLEDEFNPYREARILAPIQLAVLQGETDIVNRLVEDGAVLDRFIEPEVLKKMGQGLPFWGLLTPLQISVEQNQKEIVGILLDAGATIDYRHPATATALQLACQLPAGEKKKAELIDVLLTRGADINAPPGEDAGRTTMQAAAECGDHDLLKLLLSRGGDPFASASEKNGITIFQAALKSGSVQLVDYVFWELGSQEGSIRCVDGINYLAEAASTGNLQLLRTVSMSWFRLGLFWPKEYILSAVKVAILEGSTHLIEFLDPDLSSILQEDVCSMICECIWNGNKRIFDLLLQRSVKPNLNYAQLGYPTPLWLAMHEDEDYMAQCLINDGANPNQQSLAICRKDCCCDNRLEMPLKQAILQSGSRCIELLVDKGADIHCWIDGIQTPLLISLQEKNETAADFLLINGADPNAVGLLDEITALGLALDQGISLPTVKLLIHCGADVNQPSMWGTPLEQVVRGAFRYHDPIRRCKLLLTAQLLIEAGADINASKTGLTALEAAVQNNNKKLVKLLVNAGADVNSSSAGTSALQLAVSNNNWELAKLLVEAGADVNYSENRMTALEAAVQNNNTKLVKMLVNAGANTSTSSNGVSLLELAVRGNNVELVNLFLDEGANVNTSAMWQTALQTAADLENLELIKCLIGRGADINARSLSQTALQYAAMHGNIEIVEYLIEHGASVNEEASPYYNATALGLAVWNDHTQVAIFLTENGACVDKFSATDGITTLLQLAAKHGNHEIVTCLVENGAAVNAAPATEKGATALQFAAINGNIKMAVFLIENGARVSAKGAEIDGRTALEGAAEHGRLDMVYLLLDHDEEPDTIEERCRNAAEFAEAEHHAVIARILREYERP